MNPAIQKMLSRYPGKERRDQEQALREVLQEIALVGLWRAKFFQFAAFYGGTALRVLYGLDRFSEDLDFTLLEPNPVFRWESYAQHVVDEMLAYGFTVTLQEKEKRVGGAIRSAFLKANTLQELLKIGVSHSQLHGLHPETVIRIKIEVDTEPLHSYKTEQRYISDPVPVPIRTVTKEGLFASKMHAAFFRAWKNRVKGRDWFDVIWFIRSGIPLSLDLFSSCLEEGSVLSREEFNLLAHKRINEVDLKAAADDVRPFLRDTSQLELWSKEFFHHWFGRLTFS